MKFTALNGFVAGDDFFHYLKDTFDVLYKEGETHPKMMYGYVLGKKLLNTGIKNILIRGNVLRIIYKKCCAVS